MKYVCQNCILKKQENFTGECKISHSYKLIGPTTNTSCEDSKFETAVLTKEQFKTFKNLVKKCPAKPNGPLQVYRFNKTDRRNCNQYVKKGVFNQVVHFQLCGQTISSMLVCKKVENNSKSSRSKPLIISVIVITICVVITSLITTYYKIVYKKKLEVCL